MMKAFFKVTKWIVFFIILSSCTSKPKIGFLMDNLNRERWKKDKELFTEKTIELGGKPIIKVANSDVQLQYKMAQDLLIDGIDVLVLIPSDLNEASKIVELYHKNNIPVISYDRLVRNCKVDFYISTDNIDIGELQANYITRICPNGNYVLVGGATSDYNAFLLHLGWMNILQPLIDKGDIHIVCDEYTSNWSTEEAFGILNELIKEDKKIDAVIAGNDALALGVINALKEVGLNGNIYVAGQDADIEAIRNIVSGYQTITIYKPIASMALGAAQAAMKLANGKEPSPNMGITVNNGTNLIPSLLLKGQLVNKYNIKMTVVSEGFIAEQEIFE